MLTQILDTRWCKLDKWQEGAYTPYLILCVEKIRRICTHEKYCKFTRCAVNFQGIN